MASVKARIDALKYDDRYDVVVERGENCFYVTSTVKPLYNGQVSLPFFMTRINDQGNFQTGTSKKCTDVKEKYRVNAQNKRRMKKILTPTQITDKANKVKEQNRLRSKKLRLKKKEMKEQPLLAEKKQRIAEALELFYLNCK